MNSRLISRKQREKEKWAARIVSCGSGAAREDDDNIASTTSMRSLPVTQAKSFHIVKESPNKSFFGSASINTVQSSFKGVINKKKYVLPRGGTIIMTKLGPIQFGIPPVSARIGSESEEECCGRERQT